MLYCWLIHYPARCFQLVVVFLSAVRDPPFPPWRLPWAPRVVAGLAMQAAWLRCLSVAPPLGRGLPTRVAARAGFPGLPTAKRQQGWWSVPGLSPGAGWQPGDREMTVLLAIQAALLAGRGAAGTPVRLVPWSAGPPGPLCGASPEPGDLGSRFGFWAWGCTVPERRVLVVSVGVAAGACVGGPSGGAYAGPSVSRSGVPWRGRGSGLACDAAAQLAAGWRPCVDAPGGVRGCGAGLAVGPLAGTMCGCAVPGGCSGQVPTAPAFVGLGTAPLPAGDARCPWIPVAAWCCGWCPCAACLDARSCPGLCGAPVLEGARASVVRMASAACCGCGEVTGALTRGAIQLRG